MNNGFNFFPMKNLPHSTGITQISVMNGDLIGDARDVAMLNCGVVKVIEVVQNRNLMPFAQECLDQMRANESSAASNEDLHGASVRTKRYPSKRRTANG